MIRPVSQYKYYLVGVLAEKLFLLLVFLHIFGLFDLEI